MTAGLCVAMSIRQKFRRACISCGASGVPLGRTYRLCRVCFDDPIIRRGHLNKPSEIDPGICPYAPGTPEKIAWMTNRVTEGYAPCSPLDMTFDGSVPGIIQPTTRPEMFALPMVRTRGVERTKYGWRARPAMDGQKWDLGVFRTRQEAEAVANRFWVDKLGLFAPLGSHMRFFVLKTRKASVYAPRKRTKRKSGWPTLFDESLAIAA